MQISIDDVFLVITGHTIPPKAAISESIETSAKLKAILSNLVEERLFDHQIERVRNECKIWLIKNHPHLLIWDLGDKIWQNPTAIRFFYDNLNLESNFLEIEPLPTNIHAYIDQELELIILLEKDSIKKKLCDL